MNKTILATAAILGLTAVIFGAFGAHALKELVDPQAVSSFETGVRYQMYHAFLLFVLALLPQLAQSSKKVIYIFLVCGVLLFSFSIYLLALKSVIGVDFGKIAFLTPIGGVLLIAGWALLLYRILKMNLSKH